MIEPSAPDRCDRAVVDILREIGASDLGAEYPAISRI
jgi:hypothetical protein